MFRPRVHYADGTGSGDVRQQIPILISEVRSQPDNPVPLLKLIHACAQVWIKTQQADLLPRIITYLEKAVSLDTGAHTRPIRQLIDGVLRHCETLQLAEPSAKLKELIGRLENKGAAPAAPEPTPASEAIAEQVPVAPAPVAPQVEPAPPEPAAPEALSAPTPEEALGSYEPDSPSAPETIENLAGPDMQDIPRSFFEKKDTPETVFPVDEISPVPSAVDQELPGLDISPELLSADEEELSPSDRQSMQRQLASAHAHALMEVQKMFKEGRVYDIIRAYAGISNIRVKRHIIDGLAERLDDWHVEPLLAVGAVERDESIFKHILRVLLRQDHQTIAQQIRIDDYSPDLQRVAAAVLCELGMRSTAPRLGRCLKNGDPVVRERAATGLGRLGSAAVPHVPTLVQLIRKDPKVEVRHAAAKALNAMNEKDAYVALEEATNDCRFDEVIYAELDQMRDRFGEKQVFAATAEKKALTPAQQAQRQKMIILAVVGVIAALYFAWKYGMIPGMKPGP